MAVGAYSCRMSLFPLPTARWRNIAPALIALFAVLAGWVAWKAWHDTTADPEVLRTRVTLPGMPEGAKPVTVALISDIHVAGPDMPPERLERIVAQINALHPDAVLIAGDLISEKKVGTKLYTSAEAVSPLAGLDAPMGTFLVPGNHDHWYGWPALKRELAKTRITVLANDATQVGPLVVGGLDDEYTGHDDVAKTLSAMDELKGGRIFLGHSPDSLPELPEGSIILAGHTHCGQIVLPIIGALGVPSRFGDRFECGRIEEGSRTAIVGAGLGTSVLPIRFGTRPEILMIEFQPPGMSPTTAN